MTRRDDLDQLYRVLSELESRVGGMRRLHECTGYINWPDRGVYFFFAPDEGREDTSHRRITRIGTHAVSAGSGTSLWSRLRTHRGTKSGKYRDGGNHRGSVFRERVGEALIEREALSREFPHWGEGSSAGPERRQRELPLERRVSEYIRDLPFLWMKVDDEPGRESDRAYLERNAIALVSNVGRESIDPRSEEWLGKSSPCAEIRRSGLWNVDHVKDDYEPEFLDRIEAAVEATEPVKSSN